MRDLGHRPAVGTVDFRRKFWPPFGKTDANGRFDKQLEPTDSSYVSVECDGYGPCAVSLFGRLETAEEPFVVWMERSATLIGRFTGLARETNAKGKTTIRLTARGGLVRGDRDGARNVLGRVSSWKAEFGEGEEFRIEGLPPRVLLTVGMGGQSPFASLVLLPGEVRTVDWGFEEGTSVLHARCERSNGEPVVGAVVFLSPVRVPTRAGEALVRREVGVSDGNGEFWIQNLLAGDWQLVPYPMRESSAFVGTTEPEVVLKGNTTTEIVLEFTPALKLVGHVLGPDGLPLAEVEVRALQASVRGFATSAADGSFEVLSLRPGPVEIHLTHVKENSYALPSPQTFEAGDRDVVLQLENAATLRAQCRGGSGGATLAASMHLSAATPGAESRRAFCASGESCDFKSLRAGTYDLCAMTDDGRVAVRHGVVLSAGESVEVDLVAQAAGTLNYVYHGADPDLFLRCKLGETRVTQARILPGSDQLLTLPAGLVTLEVLVQRPFDEPGFELVEESTVTIIAGQTLRVVSEVTR